MIETEEITLLTGRQVNHSVVDSRSDGYRVVKRLIDIFFATVGLDSIVANTHPGNDHSFIYWRT